MSQSNSEAGTISPSSHLHRARRGLVGLLRGMRRPATRQSLHTTLAILKAQQEATLDGILVVDLQGRVLSYNRRFLQIWGVPDSVANTGDDNELLGYAAEMVSVPHWAARSTTAASATSRAAGRSRGGDGPGG